MKVYNYLVATITGIVILLCMGLLALAQDPAAAAEEISGGWNLFYTILELCLPIVTAALGWVSIKVASLIKAKVKNETIAGMLTRLSDTVFTLVREAEQTAVAAIKAGKDPKSPGGTKLTKEEAELIKKNVLQKFKELWGLKGLKELGTVLGLGESSLTKYLEAKVEEAVHVEGRNNGNP